MDGQSLLAAFIPRQQRPYWLVAAVGSTIIVALVLLYASWTQWGLLAKFGLKPTDGRVAVLDLDGEGSLSVWFSSAMLLLAAQVALLIGVTRSSVPDDYAGRYRTWFWAAGLWLFMSLDETASIHEAFKEVASRAAGTRLFGDGSIWWAGPYFLVLGIVGLRLFWEMRSCWLSSTLLQATGWVWALAVAAQLQLILPETGARGVMVEEAAEMAGDLLLLLSMALHARFLLYEHGDAKNGRARRNRETTVPASAAAAPAAETQPPVPNKAIPAPHTKPAQVPQHAKGNDGRRG